MQLLLVERVGEVDIYEVPAVPARRQIDNTPPCPENRLMMRKVNSAEVLQSGRDRISL